MSLLRADSLSFSYGAQTVLASVDLTVGRGDRVAVVGPNGTGKSTLLRLLAREIEPESGAVVSAGTVGFLPQERDCRAGESIDEYIARRTGVTAADAALQAAATGLAGSVPGADAAYGEALDRYLSLGGPDLLTRAQALGPELGLPDDLDRPTLTLSGGQIARLALAAIVLARFDVILLDEPSNDLDLDGLERLEAHLRGLRGGVVIVSHDRELLRRTATEVLQLDPNSHGGTLYGGGYDTYLTEVERDQARQHQEYATYTAKRDDLVSRAREQKEWARSGAKRANNAAARAKEPDKSIRAYRKQGAEQLGAQAAAVLRSLDRLQAVEQPRKEWQLQLRFGAAERSGSVVATLSRAVVRKGTFQLGPVDLQVDRGDRLAILGANGSGKSTLIDALIGRVELESGSAALGAGVVVGEIDQRRTMFDPDATLLDGFMGRTDLGTADARTLLAKFGLGAGDVLRPILSLSPGERTRSDLAYLMHMQVNLMILDEPTNHLDLAAISQLEQALDNYDGTLILVTHDRRFLENVGVTRTINVTAGAVTA